MKYEYLKFSCGIIVHSASIEEAVFLLTISSGPFKDSPVSVSVMLSGS